MRNRIVSKTTVGIVIIRLKTVGEMYQVTIQSAGEGEKVYKGTASLENAKSAYSETIISFIRG